ncbi:LysR family transcriptional regulator [Sphaerotilus mobilis]|uniref:LysR family transcriptional regulator n=1 Tax=Sphaerotilus mobilis TaxID=47994 RepID=A0A4Q7LVU7_9BURK|nr:LysR family transcriptional regulator [Sphaerotilus mobilis]RZS57799.1 LysR family transcriptional regulator [Sphaerotilus mobilis]
MELKDIDLNQLVVFQQLIVERRVSRVAETLGLTQPAVSNTLAKMRRQFGDELFLRTPAGMLPTPFAEQLAESVGYALGMIQSGLNQQTRFDPASYKRAVTIGMTDIGEIVFLPALMDRVRQEAPGVTLSTVRNAVVNLRDEMEAGKVDLAIGLLPQLKAGFFQRRLFQQRYVCLFRRGHALDKARITLQDYSRAEHLVVVSPGTGHGKVDELIKRAGVDRRVSLTVPHFVSVGHILQGSDLVATVPERLAKHLVEPFGLRYVTHPVKLPEIAINLFWHAKSHRSAASQWLRGVVVDLFADDEG